MNQNAGAAIAYARPLDRITARIRVIEAEQSEQDARARALMTSCWPSIPTSEVDRVERELLAAAAVAGQCYREAVLSGDLQAPDRVFEGFRCEVKRIARSLTKAAAQSTREALLRVEALNARNRRTL